MPGDQQMSRYHRQMIIPGWGEAAQRALAGSTVFVAGAGGLGCPALIYLAAAGVGAIRICDNDTVSESNLNRQILYGENDIGKSKAALAAQALTALNSGVRVEPLAVMIDESSADGLVAGASIIVDCLDNYGARMALNAVSVRRGIPMVHAAISGLYGQITLLDPPRTPCLACIVGGRDTDGPSPAAGATAGLVGSLEALEAVKHLTGLGETLAGTLLLVDALSARFERIALRKNPSCPVCGALLGTVPAVD
jgi:adenylyltransferase/sulfurtransferase